MSKKIKQFKKSKAVVHQCVRYEKKWFHPGQHVHIKNEYHEKRGFINKIDAKGIFLDVAEEKDVYFNLNSIEFINDLNPQSLHKYEDMVESMAREKQELLKKQGTLIEQQNFLVESVKSFKDALTYITYAITKALGLDYSFSFTEKELNDVIVNYELIVNMEKDDQIKFDLIERVEDESTLQGDDTTGTKNEEEQPRDRLEVVKEEQ